MIAANQPPPEDLEGEVAALIKTLYEAERRLDELTGGQVDTVSIGSGQPFLLRRAQEERRNREAARQTAILNALPAHIALLGADGVIVSVNEAWRQFATANHLQGPEFAVGVNYLGACDQARGDYSAEATQAAEGIRSVLAGTKSFALEYPCHSPKEECWFLMTVAPLSNALVHGAVVMHQNVTERRRAEAALSALSETTARRERILTTTLSSLADFAYIFDRAGRFVFANQALLTLWGLSLDDAIGKDFFDLGYPPELALRLQQQIQEVIETRQSITDETPYTSPTGVDGFYEYILSPAFGADGTVEFVAGSTRDISERKRAAAALRTSLTEFRQLAESMPQIVWITSAEGKYTYFSQQWMDYTGLSLEESLGDGWNKPFHPDDQKGAWDAWQLATTTAGIYAVESRLRRADGAYRWWLVRGVPHTDESGRVVKWFGTCTDIHDLKVAEVESKRANRALRMLSRTNQALLRESQEAALLDAVCRIAVEEGGYSMAWIGFAADAEGRSVTPLAHAGVESGYLDGVTTPVSDGPLLAHSPAGEAIRTGTAVIHDDISRHTDFARWLPLAEACGYRSSVCMPLSDRSSTYGVMEVFSPQVRETTPDELALLQELADDLTLGIRHRRAEADRTRLDALVRDQAETAMMLEERTRLSLRFAGVGIWDMDYSTGIFRISEIMESQLGLMPGTFGATLDSFLQCVHPLDRTAMAATMSEAARSGEDFAAEYRCQRPDGTTVWLNGKGRVELGSLGEPLRGAGISADVTERLRLEEQFQQAQKMEAVGRLAGGVAHDFNNLLTVILACCELLLQDFGQGDPRGADIKEIQSAGSRAASLTRQLLAFSRKEIIEPTALDLNEIVADLQGMLGRLIGEDVKVVVALSPTPATTVADRGQVEQVVMNLAVNARDAMPAGGRLTIETAVVELDEYYANTHLNVKPGQYVALTVTDTGTGMTAEVQGQLFEPFFTTKAAGKGTGLGLATVYGIVTRSGGSIGVYSELGTGTTFKVYFPIIAMSPTLVVQGPAAVPLAESQIVLIVEDESALREVVTRLLRKLGHTVFAAANAVEACRLFDEHPSITLILTDVVMPGESGPQLTKQLLEQRPSVKVIYMSGYTEDAIVHHGVLKPGINFLNKPFSLLSLREKIREVFESSR